MEQFSTCAAFLKRPCHRSACTRLFLGTYIHLKRLFKAPLVKRAGSCSRARPQGRTREDTLKWFEIQSSLPRPGGRLKATMQR